MTCGWPRGCCCTQELGARLCDGSGDGDAAVSGGDDSEGGDEVAAELYQQRAFVSFWSLGSS